MPIQRVDKWLLSDDEVPNIFAIGLVCTCTCLYLSVCLSVCLYVCLSLCMLAFYFFYRFQELDLSTEALLTKESNREEMWIDLVEGSLKQVGNFDKVSTILSIHQFIYLYIH